MVQGRLSWTEGTTGARALGLSVSDILDRVSWATVRTAGLEKINEAPKPGSTLTPHAPLLKGVVYSRLTKDDLEPLIPLCPPFQHELQACTIMPNFLK